MIRITCVCGARPNFMKIAPLVAAFRKTGRIEARIVHTGQHYDAGMDRVFFEQLQIPEPDLNLEVGSGSPGGQMAEIMRRFEPVVVEDRPDWVLVVGDVNSTIACALVASKLNIRVAHVEAGLRSFDRIMPEEINRLLTDAISDLLLVSEPSGIQNLRREGVAEDKIRFVGNVMIDTLMQHRARAGQSSILETHGLNPKRYAVVTLHRPANVDTPETLASILNAFEVISKDMPIIFPIHPRTGKNIAAMGLDARVESLTGLKTPEPLGYLDFLKLMDNSFVVLTDSGGIQEETTILGVPCLTLRENTERPATITHGTNRLCGSSAEAILAAFAEIKSGGIRTDRTPELWDGHAAERIARIFVDTSPE